MSTAHNAHKVITPRSLGSDTGVTEGFRIPWHWYHGGRAARGGWRHRRYTGPVLVLLYLWAVTGSLLMGAVLMGAIAGLLVAGALTGLVAWNRRGARAAYSYRDAWRDMRRQGRQSRQRATIKRQWPIAARSAGLIGSVRRVPLRLRQLKPTGDGSWVATVDSGTGVDVEHIQRATRTLANVVRCHDVTVADLGFGRARLEIHFTDVLGRELHPADVPIGPADKLTFGIHGLEGAPATLDLGLSLFIGGMSGHGKSTLAHWLVADHLRQRIPLRLYVADPKGGMEFRQYRKNLGEVRNGGEYEVRAYAAGIPDCEKLMKQFERDMRARAAELGERGVRKWKPSVEFPHCVLIVDEALALTDTVTWKKGSDGPVGQVGSQGRAAGFAAYVLAQVGHAATIGSIRELLPQRIAVATRTPQQTDTFLGQGAATLGADCHLLSGKPGVGYAFDAEEGRPRRVRIPMVTDADLTLIAAGRLPRAVTEGMEDRLGKDRREVGLYRWYGDLEGDGSGEEALGYIGVSYNVLQREAEHNANLRAFMRGPSIRRTTEYFPSDKAAKAAEVKAIAAERPAFNDQHNHANPDRRTDTRRRRAEKVGAET